MPLKDKQARNEYTKAWNRRKYAESSKYRKETADRNTLKREERKEYLSTILGDCCVMCGSKENLEYDHINLGLKTSQTSILVIGEERLADEINNIQILCSECHKKRSNAQRKAAISVFGSLPLEEQEQLIQKYWGHTGFLSERVSLGKTLKET